MTCRDIETLIMAERDGALTAAKRTELSDHLAACPACREFRLRVAASLEAYKSDLARAPVPDVDDAWRDLRERMHAPARRTKRRPLAPVAWFAGPLAAAAALAFVFFSSSSPYSPETYREVPVNVAATDLPPPPPPPPASAPARVVTPPTLTTPYDPSIIAGADYVEVGNPNASTMVYVDRESGWLVVWVTDVDAAPTSG